MSVQFERISAKTLRERSRAERSLLQLAEEFVGDGALDRLQQQLEEREGLLRDLHSENAQLKRQWETMRDRMRCLEREFDEYAERDQNVLNEQREAQARLAERLRAVDAERARLAAENDKLREQRKALVRLNDRLARGEPPLPASALGKPAKLVSRTDGWSLCGDDSRPPADFRRVIESRQTLGSNGSSDPWEDEAFEEALEEAQCLEQLNGWSFEQLPLYRKFAEERKSLFSSDSRCNSPFEKSPIDKESEPEISLEKGDKEHDLLAFAEKCAITPTKEARTLTVFPVSLVNELPTEVLATLDPYNDSGLGDLKSIEEDEKDEDKKKDKLEDNEKTVQDETSNGKCSKCTSCGCMRRLQEQTDRKLRRYHREYLQLNEYMSSVKRRLVQVDQMLLALCYRFGYEKRILNQYFDFRLYGVNMDQYFESIRFKISLLSSCKLHLDIRLMTDLVYRTGGNGFSPPYSSSRNKMRWMETELNAIDTLIRCHHKRILNSSSMSTNHTGSNNARRY